MKILSSGLTRELDAFTIQSEVISSIDLMERAAKAFTEKFITIYSNKQPVQIVCGLGNNGGDGLAIARLLHICKYQTEVFIIEHGHTKSEDFLTNEERLRFLPVTITEVRQTGDLKLKPKAIIVDALFGSGLNKPVTGLSAEVISLINSQHTEVVAIDIASGLYADLATPDKQALKVNRTFTFHLPKLAFMIPENDPYSGKWEILDIGLSSKFIDAQKGADTYTTAQDAAQILKIRSKFSHKGTFGHSLLIAGSSEKTGAAIMAAKSCLRAGTGLLTVHLPQSGYEIMQISCPEAMVSIDESGNIFTGIEEPVAYAAIAFGPGMGKDPKTMEAMKSALKNLNKPVVLDADALNILAEQPDMLKLVPENSILTPHLKEFERLAGPSENHFERLQLLREFSSTNNVIVVLKGAHTAISDMNGNIFFNSTGNAGMAKGGSGDVLTGIILALLSQQYEPSQAARLGVFLHGLAGDLARKKWGEEAMLPSDLTDALGKAFKYLHKIKGA